MQEKNTPEEVMKNNLTLLSMPDALMTTTQICKKYKIDRSGLLDRLKRYGVLPVGTEKGFRSGRYGVYLWNTSDIKKAISTQYNLHLDSPSLAN